MSTLLKDKKSNLLVISVFFKLWPLIENMLKTIVY